MNTQQTLNVDFSLAFKEAEKTLLNAGVSQARSQAVAYFNTWYNHIEKRTEKGPGVLEIEEYLDKKFGSEEFQAQMKKFFDENFNRLFEEAMEKAIKHYTNKAVFAMATKEKGNDTY